MAKPVVLIFIEYYLPGYKNGGPIRTISNIVERLGDDFKFKIITRDRDSGEKTPYSSIIEGQWQPVGKAQVLYLSPKASRIIALHKLINNTHFDILYLNSFFDLTFTIKPLIIRFLSRIISKPIILAPRGEFSPGALNLKKIKKTAYIAFVSRLKLYKNIIWHASSEQEKIDIKNQAFITTKNIHIALNLPASSSIQTSHAVKDQLPAAQSLKILFLARISPMKNLDYALNVLMKVNAQIIFDIYGPLTDPKYWKKCQSLIASMPENITVNYCGSVAHELTASIFQQYNLFFLPTRGENYGHVIAESLSEGTPVLISDRTPWHALEEDLLGWSFPLENNTAFVQCIEQVSAQFQRKALTPRAHIQTTTLKTLQKTELVEATRQLFLTSLI
ncbi:MAG: glycosyltransferase family 4 protein [Gammaproteobacteria bacterium]|nr:glycosyltransferase family 4 protein [Gammaproteobacteria bacterium]MCH9717188.1 glycosyltransferase family 4 protein [Gammaproteobacteria bacterium]MCH9763345.1 glycosyltransferase family 4 protein [Gammaproteobacteria bacterium]